MPTFTHITVQAQPKSERGMTFSVADGRLINSDQSSKEPRDGRLKLVIKPYHPKTSSLIVLSKFCLRIAAVAKSL